MTFDAAMGKPCGGKGEEIELSRNAGTCYALLHHLCVGPEISCPSFRNKMLDVAAPEES